MCGDRLIGSSCIHIFLSADHIHFSLPNYNLPFNFQFRFEQYRRTCTRYKWPQQILSLINKYTWNKWNTRNCLSSYSDCVGTFLSANSFQFSTNSIFFSFFYHFLFSPKRRYATWVRGQSKGKLSIELWWIFLRAREGSRCENLLALRRIHFEVKMPFAHSHDGQSNHTFHEPQSWGVGGSEEGTDRPLNWWSPFPQSGPASRYILLFLFDYVVMLRKKTLTFDAVISNQLKHFLKFI